MCRLPVCDWKAPICVVCNCSAIPDQPKLNLRGAVLRGARDRQFPLHWLDLDNADFAGADLSYTEWQQVRADAVRLVGAKLTGAVFRDCSLKKQMPVMRSAIEHSGCTAVCKTQSGLEVTWPAVIGALNNQLNDLKPHNPCHHP